MAPPKIYAVRKGRQTGFFSNWPDCQAQVNGFPGAQYKSFKTMIEAEEYMQQTTAIVAPRLHSETPEATTAFVFATAADGLLETIDIYTDGACEGNGQFGARGGIGVFFGLGDPRNISEPLPGEIQTNNRAEMLAAIRALQVAPLNVIINLYTDSTYVMKGITEWIHAWKTNQWRGSRGSAVLNQDLWVVLDDAVNRRRGNDGRSLVNFIYCKGHAGVFGNEQADYLAVQGSRLRV